VLADWLSLIEVDRLELSDLLIEVDSLGVKLRLSLFDLLMDSEADKERLFRLDRLSLVELETELLLDWLVESDSELDWLTDWLLEMSSLRLLELETEVDSKID